MEPLFTEFEKYLFPSSTLSEQLSNLSTNYTQWETIKSAPVAVRPTRLDLPLTIDTTPSDIPSPTVSEDIPSPTENESFDSGFNEESDVIELLSRRHSLPVVLLESKSMLSRRPSLPDGPQNKPKDTKHLLDMVAGHLSQSHSHSVCREKDKVILSEILENLFLSQSVR